MPDTQAESNVQREQRPAAIGLRALLVGMGLTALLSWLSAYSVNMVKGTTLTEDHNMVGAMSLLFVLVVCGNGLAKLAERRFGARAVLAAAVVSLIGVGVIVGLSSLAANLAEGGVRQAAQIVLTLTGLAWGSFALIAVCRLIEKPFRGGSYVSMNQAELLTAFVMMLLATAICTVGLSMIMPQTITHLTAFAGPENRWSVLIEPYVPAWLLVQDKEAITAFYRGIPDLPQDASIMQVMRAIPWGAWLPTIGYWLILILSLYFTSMCMMVILRRQWMEKEILIYPLTRVPMELTADDDGEPGQPHRGRNGLMRNPLAWLGFAIPFVYFSLRGLGAHFPEMISQFGLRQGQFQDPQWWIIITFCLFAGLVVSLVSDARKAPIIGLLLIFHLSVYSLLDNTVNIILYPSFAILAFVYLINLDVSFSLWWFAILALMVKGLLVKLGIRWTETLTGYGVSGAPRLYHACIGAMFVFVFYGLWIARRHLWDVTRKAMFGAKDVDDSDEVMSYRMAFFGMIAGLVVMTIWLVKSGLSVGVAMFFLVCAMVIFLGLSRIVAEGGLACCVSPAIAPELAVSKLGSLAIGKAGLAALAFTYIWTADIRVFLMAEASTSLKLAGGVRRGRRRVAGAMVVAIMTSIVVSMGTVLYLSYRSGGLNLENWYYNTGPARPFTLAADRIDSIERLNQTEQDIAALETELGRATDPSETARTEQRLKQKHEQAKKEHRTVDPYNKGWIASGVGATMMGVLIFLRNAVVGWPLHPIGLPMAGTWMMDWLWMPIFLAWMIKEVLLRYGGPVLYRRSVPVFLGMILGQFTAGLLWLVIDYFTATTGNELFRF